MNAYKPVIGITTGDINGIGIELIIKVFSDSRMMEMCTPVIFGSNKVINFYKKMMPEWSMNFISIKTLDNLKNKNVHVYQTWDEEIEIKPGQLTDVAGKFAIQSLEIATNFWLENKLDILVTSPIHKSNTYSENFKFVGHTLYLKHRCNVAEVGMMLYNDVLKVALVTEHVPLKEVPGILSTKKICQKAELIHQSLIRDFGIDKPKIAILGLNPHAGDNGQIGMEEEEIIIPAIEKLNQKNILAFGPYSSDAYFAQGHYKKFDATLAMYHDQGLIPFKTIAGLEGVNYTCGLPKVRTSPDHGVAFDITGKNIADEESLRFAIFEAINIFRQRNAYDEQTANPLVRNTVVMDGEGE